MVRRLGVGKRSLFELLAHCGRFVRYYPAFYRFGVRCGGDCKKCTRWRKISLTIVERRYPLGAASDPSWWIAATLLGSLTTDAVIMCSGRFCSMKQSSCHAHCGSSCIPICAPYQD